MSLPQKPKAVFNWSGGKDSALALTKILQEGTYEVVTLLTTISQESKRSSLHAIPTNLLQKQATCLGIPIRLVELTEKASLRSYEETMKQAITPYLQAGITHFIFGDIFLEEIKKYREQQLSPYGIQVIEPLWGKTSQEIIAEFLDSGLQTIIITTEADKLDDTYIGRKLNRDFLKDLPPGVDPCGENGEYHTFCYDGTIFQQPVTFSLGQPQKETLHIQTKDGKETTYSYWFADLNE